MIDKEKYFEFKIDPDNGMIVGRDGAHYDSEAEAAYYGHMGFCGCGCPEEMHAFVLDCLAVFDRDTEGGWDRSGIDVLMEKVMDSPELAAYFIAYTLGMKKFTDHGPDIGESWLTEAGKQLLKIGPHKENEDV